MSYNSQKVYFSSFLELLDLADALDLDFALAGFFFSLPFSSATSVCSESLTISAFLSLADAFSSLGSTSTEVSASSFLVSAFPVFAQSLG